MSVRLGFALGIALLWLFAAAQLRPAHAETPGTATISIVPADGKTRGIQLRAQTVDAVIKQEADGMWADTRVWVQLYNPARQAVIVPIALPGPQLGSVELPDGFGVTLNNKTLSLQPLQPKKDGPIIGQMAPITLTARGAASLRIRYRQRLAEKDALVTFTYPLTATLRWSGTPESLRVTVRFDPAAAPEQVLSHKPAAKRYDPDGITWHLENRRAAESINVAFLSQAWWAEFVAARAAAAGAGLQAYLALSGYYRHLASLPAPSFDPEADYRDRYYAAEVAALQAGLAAPDPTATAAEQLAAHARLAELYQERAGRSDGSLDDAYLQMAAAELQAAVMLDDGDTELRAAAANLYARLAQTARARGDLVTAEQHQARLDALRAPAGAADEQTLAQAAALARAGQALDAGDLSTARRLVVETVGQDAVTLPGAPPPVAAQTLVTVTTASAQRTFAIRLSGGDAAASALLAQAARALSACPWAKTGTAGNELTITLPYTDTTLLVVPQARLAAALPAAPELALLIAALTPQRFAWERSQEIFQDSEHYVDQINLTSVAESWEAAAQRSERAGQGQGAATAQLSSNALLARLQRAFLIEDAAAWRSLAAHSRIEYRLAIDQGRTERHWELRPGEDHLLEAATARLRFDRIALIVAAAAALLALGLVAAVRRNARTRC